ncbi:hypothetical protein ATN84_22420 [Paramesorhizobium deserti]|uniref:Uncharacterized protein n=1 Tax=Paramesorhizobium deserti TaxID=1494590 RepID=A0A135HP31_9HYPH|nr:hypothetical protein [Paramesorhizobium deserti]KXF74968.1 hypothetical protein ATN84_22420 [Paramesorhizobium deserti]
MAEPNIDQPKWLKAVDVDLQYTTENEAVGVMVMIDSDGNQARYLIGPESAEGIRQAMVNYLDIHAGVR